MVKRSMSTERSRIWIGIVMIILIGSTGFVFLQFSFNLLDTPEPDMILYNAEVITMENSPAQAEAIAIHNGSIIAVGGDTEILAMRGPNTTVFDLGGNTILPGFIDSHTHDFGDRYLTDIGDIDEVVNHLLESGWTSVSELFVNQDRLDELQALDQQNRLRLHVNAYLPLSWQFERFGDWYKAYQPGQEFSSKLRIGGVKLFMDGSYVRPIHYFNASELKSLVQEAHDLGFQIAIHSVVDNSTDVVLDVYESVLDGESNDLYRHRIEHLVYLRDDQINRISSLQILPSFQLSWFTSDWNQAGSFPLLEQNSHLVARWRDIIESGAPAIGSTDYPWNQMDIRSVPKILSMAVTRMGVNGLTPTDWMMDQTLAIEQALRLLTIDAAYGTFQEDIKGSIEVGKLADLVVLSGNPLSVPASELANLDVLMTMVEGVIEYESQAATFLHTHNIDEFEQGKHFVTFEYLRHHLHEGFTKLYLGTATNRIKLG
ncbi:MAG: amidohydrolase family protein [Candidatus Lokiarchaeota archaeon]|nr:amidohydrolase family protein [Candidatus Lokiarchaeota archaeon]